MGVNDLEITNQSAEQVNQLIRDHRHRCDLTIEYDVAGQVQAKLKISNEWMYFKFTFCFRQNNLGFINILWTSVREDIILESFHEIKMSLKYCMWWHMVCDRSFLCPQLYITLKLFVLFNLKKLMTIDEVTVFIYCFVNYNGKKHELWRSL